MRTNKTGLEVRERMLDGETVHRGIGHKTRHAMHRHQGLVKGTDRSHARRETRIKSDQVVRNEIAPIMRAAQPNQGRRRPHTSKGVKKRV